MIKFVKSRTQVPFPFFPGLGSPLELDLLLPRDLAKPSSPSGRGLPRVGVAAFSGLVVLSNDFMNLGNADVIETDI